MTAEAQRLIKEQMEADDETTGKELQKLQEQEWNRSIINYGPQMAITVGLNFEVDKLLSNDSRCQQGQKIGVVTA